MKKILSCFVALFAAVSLYATDLNIYASGLNATRSAGVTSVQYTLNAQATAVNVKLYNGSSTPVKVIAVSEASKLTKGTHSVALDLSDLADGTYTWAIEAIAPASNAAAPVLVNDPDNDGAFQYYLPQDVVVDNSTESPFFGRIYVSESMAGANDGGTVTTQDQTRGLYIYNADLTFTNGQATALTGYEGGLGGSGRTSFRRLAIDEAGNVYVCSTHASNKGVYRIDPANPSANFTTILSGKSVNSIEVVGTNLVTLEDVTASTGTFNTYDMSIIPVGDAVSSVSSLGNSYIFFANEYNSIREDKRGGLWLCEYRGADSYNFVVHINALGEQDFVIDSENQANFGLNYTYRGTIAVSPNGEQLAICTNRGVVIYNVTYAAGTGVPTLESLYSISRASGSNTDGIAFDVAGNLYVACASVERFYAYALPKATNSYETPARSTNTIEVGAEEIHVTGVSLNQTEANLEAGHNLALVATIVPGDATDKSVSWVSDDTSVATVSNTGVVTAVGEGNATITVTTTDGTFTATCDVTVWQTHVSSVTVEPSEIALGVGFKQQLTATILPADATNKTYAWSSDDEAIATVANGMVTAVAVGSTTIKATAEDGGIVGSCTVNVTPAVAHIGAYGLAVVKNANDYTFSFNATMAATSGALEFYNEAGNKVGEIALAGVVAGANQKTIAFAEIPAAPAQELTWGVRLTAADNAAFSKIHEAEAITGRSHLAVDASPESPFFGQIYQFNRTAAAGTSGLYIYDQSYNRSALNKMGDNVVQGVMRLSVDADGIVWGADYTDGHSGIYIMDPSDLSSYSQFYQGTRAGSGLFTNGNVEVGGSSPVCFVYGKDENAKLYTVQEDMTGHGSNPIAVYNMGTTRTWSTAPSQVFQLSTNAGGNCALYVVKEGIWISQNRSAGNNTVGADALAFYGLDGTKLAQFGGDSRINGSNGAGMTVDPKHNKLYLVDASTNILEFNIEYAAETNVPTLTLANKHYTGYTYISSMSMDYAGNLYVTAGNAYSNSGSMKMIVYAPATNGDNTTITPAPKAATVSTPDVETLYMIGVDNWNPTIGTAMEKVSDNVFRCQVDFNATKYFAFSTVLADNNDEGGWAYVNAHRYAGTVANATLVPGEEMALVYGVDRSMQMTAGKYNITVDLNTMKVSAIAVVDQLFEIGDNQGWELTGKVAMTKVSDNVFEAELTFTNEISYFAFTTSASTSDWGDVNSHRYASDVYQERVDDESEVNLTAGDEHANLTILPGVYTVRVDFNTNKVTVAQSVAKVSFDSEIGYATYYNGTKGYTMPANVTGYAFNYPGAGLAQAFEAGDDVPAGVALVLAGPAGTFDLVLKTGVPAVDLANQLRGTDADELTTGPTADSYLFYGLSLAAVPNDTPESVGFYWMAENGAAFTNKAHKAYLALPENFLAPARILFNENGATGIENVEGQEKAVKFIENGQIYIQKNGVVYDAMGRVIR